MMNINIAKCNQLLSLSHHCPFHVRKWTKIGLNVAVFSTSSNKAFKGVDLKWSYLQGPSPAPLLGITLGQLMNQAAKKFGDREAIVSKHQNIRKTFQQVDAESDLVASGLASLGLRPGDRLGIWSHNNYEWYITQFAAAKAGLVLVNINPSYKPQELKYALNKVSVKGIICDDHFKTSNYYNILSEIAPELCSSPAGELKCKEVPHLKCVITVSESPLRGTFAFRDLFESGNNESKYKIQELSSQIQFDEVTSIQFTSGTTGKPKAAMLSHHNIINNGVSIGRRLQYDVKAHRICLPVPLFHCFGCVAGTVVGAIYGATCLLPSQGFDAKAALQTIQDEKATSLYGAPTMFVDILQRLKSQSYDISSLHAGIMTGSPCPEQLLRELMQNYNMKELIVMYGMTETSPVSFQCFATDPPVKRSTTIGYPADHVETKIVDREGRIVRTGESGELWIRGYSVFLGYWGDKEKTREAITEDRWFKTGDLAVMNRDGYGNIVGRIKDMIIRGGENIYPAEIENFYMGHPDIMEAQVIGVPDTRMGEELCMWVKRSSDDLTVEAIKQWSKGKIAHNKVPRYILFKSEFPLTVTGKIQKFKMLEESKQELHP